MWVPDEADALEDADPSEDRKIRLSIGYPEFMQLAMTPGVASVMIVSLQLALKMNRRRNDSR